MRFTALALMMLLTALHFAFWGMVAIVLLIVADMWVAVLWIKEKLGKKSSTENQDG